MTSKLHGGSFLVVLYLFNIRQHPEPHRRRDDDGLLDLVCWNLSCLVHSINFPHASCLIRSPLCRRPRMISPSICPSEITCPGHTFSPLDPIWLNLTNKVPLGKRCAVTLKEVLSLRLFWIWKFLLKIIRLSYWSNVAQSSPTECLWSKACIDLED